MIQPAPGAQPGQPRPKVLIIDDEEDLVEMLAMRLKASGFEVDTALDGPAGLEKARQRPPDVVLLDNVMPQMEGWEVCHRLRGDPRTQSVKIIVMTAGSPGKAQRRGREERVDHVVFKPYDHEELIGLIAQTGGAPQAPPREEGYHA